MIKLNDDSRNTQNCINCLVKSPIFNFLDDDELKLINESRCQVNYKAGETIRKQGAYLSHVISVNSGLCKMYLEGVEYRELILRIIKPTNFIGGPGLFVDFKHHFTVTALIDTKVCFIDSNIFKQIMHSNKKFSEEFMQDMSKNTISVYKRIISLTQKQMAGRIADALIYLSDDIFENRKFDMILSKRELADFTKMSKDNFVKVLKTFTNEKLINLSENTVEILDYDKLLRISSIG